MLDIRQTAAYAKHLKRQGWTVEENKAIYYYIKKIPLIGSLIKIQRPEIINNKTINQIINKYRAFQIVIEPKDRYQVSSIKYQGFKLSKAPYLPTKTLLLDLSHSKEKLFSGLRKDCKQAIRKNKDLRIKIYELDEVEKFRQDWKKAVGLKRYVPSTSHLTSLKQSFGDNCIFLASNCIDVSEPKVVIHHRYTKEIMSGAIFLMADKTGYYWQAFTNPKGRKLQVQYKIVWKGILWAKERGTKIFDFEGIYDGRFPDKSWLGFSHFKKSFGGYEVEYPGSYARFRIPI